MNPVIDLITAHRSIRKFTTQPIEAEQLNAILRAGQAAASSSFIQCSSVIRVTDLALRQQLASCAGEQAYVLYCAEFLVFCADYHRHTQIAPDAQTGFVEQLLIGSIDAALMAQNMLLAAQSLGLGGVYIGGLRNQPQQVTELLALPKHVIPLFGLCLGHPDQQPEQKPRLPQALVVHENRYPEKLDLGRLEQYDQQMRAYYAARAANSKQQDWSSQVRSQLSKESRPFMLSFLQQQGFATK
jgi:nitroreductase